MSIPQGSFVWHDLATTDVEAAKTFYGQIIPWTTKPWEDAETYTMWVNDGTPIGGVLPLSEKRKAAGDGSHWLPFVYVYDVDACTRQAAKIGGAIRTSPKEMPNAGCWSIVTDPFGANIGLFEPTQSPPGHSGAPRRGEFSWHELPTTDYKAALDFYGTLFRWEKTSEFDMGEMGVYCMFGQRGHVYGGMFNRTAEMPPSAWMSYVRVDDVKSVAQRVKEIGGTVFREPHQVPGGDWIAACADPTGALFAVHTPSPG